jgi:hypothetical protein
MPHSFRGQITIEKSPSYFVTPEVCPWGNAEMVSKTPSCYCMLLM